MSLSCGNTNSFTDLVKFWTQKDASGNKYLLMPGAIPEQYLSYDQTSGNQTVDFTEWAFFGTGDHSISFWLRFTALPADGEYIYIMHQQPHNPQWFIYINSRGELIFNGALALEFPFCSDDGDVVNNLGDWVHCVLTHDRDGVLKWTINTISQDAIAGTGSSNTMDDNRNPLQWGGGAGLNYYPYDIDEICFFNRLLTPAEISTLYGGGTPDTGGDPTAITGCINYWKIDGDTAPAITDSVGTADGVMQNMLQTNIVNH